MGDFGTPLDPLKSLPEEIFLLEIVERHLDRASTFVLSKVNRFFFDLLSDRALVTNPLVDFILGDTIGLVKWDQEGPGPSILTFEITLAAAKHGRLEILKYLVHRGCPINDQCFQAAIQFGHLDVLKYLYSFMRTT